MEKAQIRKFLIYPTIFMLLIILLIFFLKPSIIGYAVKDNNQCPPDCNIVFILVDTLRADHLGVYGYERDTSSNIDNFAEDSIVFNNARSQASCTFPSVNSMFTSKYPLTFFERFYQNEKNLGIPKEMAYLPEILNEKGYSTIAVSASPIIVKTPTEFNGVGEFDRGFDIFDEECQWLDASCVNKKAFKFIKDAKKPFFIYLHYMDVHDPYLPKKTIKKFTKDYNGKDFIEKGEPNPIADMLYYNGSELNLTTEDINHLIDLYDEEVVYFDYYFGKLLEELSKKDLLDKTIIVISSDHGEAFLEHNHIKHCSSLFDTQTKVPLIIKIPSIEQKGTRDSIVQNIDIAPTLLFYLNLDISNYDFEGKNLKSVIEKDSKVNNYVYSFQGRLASVDNGDYKLISSPGNFLLFNLKEDNFEKTNLADKELEMLEKLKKELYEKIDEIKTTHSSNFTNVFEDNNLEKLKTLGYL